MSQQYQNIEVHSIGNVVPDKLRCENVIYWPAWEMHCNNLRLVLGLGLVRVSSRVRVRVKVIWLVLWLRLALEQAGW